MKTFGGMVLRMKEEKNMLKTVVIAAALGFTFATRRSPRTP